MRAGVVLAIATAISCLQAIAPAKAAPKGELLPEVDFILRNAEEYCNREPADCEMPAGDVEAEDFQRISSLLKDANRQVNLELRFAFDRDQYGAPDFWTVAKSGAGDCEDYALTKRRRLIEAGIDPRNLRMTLVRFSENGRIVNHAMLGVVTDIGMRYLDMNSDQVGDEMASVIRFGYRFVAMQSSRDFTIFQPMDVPLKILSAASR